MKETKHILLIGAFLFIAGAASAQNARDAAVAGAGTVQSARFVGADNCKDCHNRPEKGAQYDHWLGNPHSQAVRTLSSEKASEYARKAGISNAAGDERCLKCHSTYNAAPASMRTSEIKQAEGVSCESCHGAGSAYRSQAVMQDRNLAMRNGLVEPSEIHCVLCHNPESPFYKEFNFRTAFERTAHSNPSRELKIDN